MHRPLFVVTVLALGLGACSQAPSESAGDPASDPSAAAAEHGHDHGSPADPSGGLWFAGDTDERHMIGHHSFGEVRVGRILVHTFLLENRDAAPIAIQSVQAACHCTRVARLVAVTPEGQEIEGDPLAEGDLVRVPPGARLELEVRMDTALLQVPERERVSILRVRTDSEVTPFLNLELHVKPLQLFRVNPVQVELGEIPVHGGKTEVTRIFKSDRASPARVVGVASAPEGIAVELSEGSSPSGPMWTLTMTVPPGWRRGVLQEQVHIETTDAEGEPDPSGDWNLTVNLIGSVVDDVRLYPPTLNLRQVEADEPWRVEGMLRALIPGARMRIVEAQLEGDIAQYGRIESEVLDADASERGTVWRVVVSGDGGLPPGRLDGRLRLTLDDSQTPEVSASITGWVR